MKRKSILTMFAITLVFAVSLLCLTACGEKPVSYSITVTNGTANKVTAVSGDSVTITANEIDGKIFNEWIIVGFDTTDLDLTQNVLTFTMPANEVTATAVFEDVYEMELENCTSDKEVAKHGEPVTFTAGEYEGKRFTGWYIKGVDDLTGLDLTKSPLTINMPAKDIVVAAQLEQLYKITVLGGCTADKEWAAEGEQVTVTKPTPPEGHAFYWWSTGITQDWSNRENTVTFTMPAGDVQISASKVLLNYLFTMVGGTATGVKSGEPNTVTHGRSDGFDYGTDVTITANASEKGMKFARWTITGIDTSELDLTARELTFTMSANVVRATANYDFINYTVSVTGGTAQVNDGVASASVKAHYGEQVTITANAPTGKEFVMWSFNGLVSDGLTLTDAELTFTMPAGNVTAMANYKNVNYTVIVNGGTANVTSAHYGDNVTITANVPTGKDFVMWSFEGFVPDGLTLTNPELTFTMPAGNVTATAELRDLAKRSVTVQGGAAQVGDGTLATSLEAYCGDTVTLTAYQSAEKTFVKWTIEGIDDTTGLDLTQRVLTLHSQCPKMM